MQNSSRALPFKQNLAGASPATDAILFEVRFRSGSIEPLSPITHFLIGWTVANSAPSLEKRDRALITWASVIPDLDGLGIIPEILTRNSAHPLNWWSDYHHIIGHNLGFALLITVLAATFTKNKFYAAPLVFLSFHLHLIGDLIGARGPDGEQWPIPYLLPFSRALDLTWSGQWPLNAWQNMLLTAILVAVTVILAWKRGFSPLELFSKRADAIFVKTLRNRFGT